MCIAFLLLNLPVTNLAVPDAKRNAISDLVGLASYIYESMTSLLCGITRTIVSSTKVTANFPPSVFMLSSCCIGKASCAPYVLSLTT